MHCQLDVGDIWKIPSLQQEIPLCPIWRPRIEGLKWILKTIPKLTRLHVDLRQIHLRPNQISPAVPQKIDRSTILVDESQGLSAVPKVETNLGISKIYIRIFRIIKRG